MNQITIYPPTRLDATIDLPASKSISNRALIIHKLAGGTMPRNLSDCDDTEVVRAAFESMPPVIDIKAAGTAMRFLTAYLSATPGEHTITGTERMKHRPIGILVDALRHLGADISYEGEDGFPPLHIRGHALEGGRLEIPGSVSSQFISALLLVAPTMSRGLELRMTGQIISRPYIDLTLWTMREYGADAEWTDMDTITVKPKPYKQRDYLVENDWSAASYWYEMLALMGDTASSITLKGLMDRSMQGDSVVKYLFSLLGVHTEFASRGNEPTNVTLKLQHRPMPRLEYDFTGSPDLAQTMVCTCVGMGVPFDFAGLSTLKIKETDRIEALKCELKKLGYVITDRDNNSLHWNGERCEPTLEPIDTYEDHRMAMAMAPLAIKFPGLRINNPQVVTKSYPAFWEDLINSKFRSLRPAPPQ